MHVSVTVKGRLRTITPAQLFHMRLKPHHQNADKKLAHSSTQNTIEGETIWYLWDLCRGDPVFYIRGNERSVDEWRCHRFISPQKINYFGNSYLVQSGQSYLTIFYCNCFAWNVGWHRIVSKQPRRLNYVCSVIKSVSCSEGYFSSRQTRSSRELIRRVISHAWTTSGRSRQFLPFHFLHCLSFCLLPSLRNLFRKFASGFVLPNLKTNKLFVFILDF